MNQRKLKTTNAEILARKEWYKTNDKLLDIIIFNKNDATNEEIAIAKDLILERNDKLHLLKLQLVKQQELFFRKKVINVCLINNFELELIINKFWFKFYSKLHKQDQQIVKYWREEYLDCYKKQFFWKKKFEIKDNQLSHFAISEINNSLSNVANANAIIKSNAVTM